MHTAPWMPTVRSQVTAGSWSAHPAVRGQGTILVGRFRDRTLIALAPPGVALPTSSDRDVPYSFNGWRLAVWLPGLDGPRWMETRRPEEHLDLTLTEALQSVPPESARWIFERCQRLARSAAGYLAPDATGKLAEDVEEAQLKLDALLGELAEIFPREAWELYRPKMPSHVWIPDVMADTAPSPSADTQPEHPAALISLDGR